MEIKVGIYTIYSDKYNMWITKRVKTRKASAKNEYLEERVTGYYDSIEGLMNSFIDRGIRGTDARTIESYLKQIEKVKRDAKRIVKEMLKNDSQN